MKYRLYTWINVFGLSFGLICFLFISLWVWDEWSYDRFHANGDKIYQLFTEQNKDGDHSIVPYAPSALVSFLHNDVPEIAHITRVFPSTVAFKKEDLNFSEQGIYADASFFKVFQFQLSEGANDNPFVNANSIVISSKLAEKYFPNESALGKTLEISSTAVEPFTVSAVMDPVPANSSLKFDFILSYDEFENKHRPWWKSSNPYSFSNYNVEVYMELQDEADLIHADQNINKVLYQHSTINNDVLFAYPFKKTYLYNDFSESRDFGGRIEDVRLMAVIGIVVLIIAAINFINLSTAVATKNKLQVGLRKVIGASKSQIYIQAMTESLLVVIISMVLAVTAVEILLPSFNELTGKHISIPFDSPFTISILTLGAMGLVLISGTYPAIILSRVNFSSARKNTTPSSLRLNPRKVLVILQFTLSIIFLVFTIVVFDQIDFVRSKALGLSVDNIIRHPLHSIRGSQDEYKSELQRLPGVKAVTFTEQDPLNHTNGNNGVFWTGKPEDAVYFFNVIQVSAGFTETLELEILEGTRFKVNSTGEKQFIVNEEAVREMMLDDPVGEKLTVWGNEGRIVGVVKDYHHQSLSRQIEPVIIVSNPRETWNCYVSLRAGDIQNTLDQIQSLYERRESYHPFEYSFIEEDVENSYQDVTTLGQLTFLLASAAIIISCLGLFGLAAFVSEQRSQETGVRKVLGAKVLGLLWMFSVGFLRLVAVAVILALPISWYGSMEWLSTYAYHIDLGLTPFVSSSLLALSIALIAVSYHVIRIAHTNPAEVLRNE